MKELIQALGVIAMLLLVSLIVTFPLMLTINYVFASSFLVTVFGVAQLGFWKTFFALTVTSWLFKNHTVSTK
jgi:hypothetical protein